LQAQDKISIANEIRKLGNQLFAERDDKLLDECYHLYDKALRYLESDILDTPEEQETLLEVLLRTFC